VFPVAPLSSSKLVSADGPGDANIPDVLHGLYMSQTLHVEQRLPSASFASSAASAETHTVHLILHFQHSLVSSLQDLQSAAARSIAVVFVFTKLFLVEDDSDSISDGLGLDTVSPEVAAVSAAAVPPAVDVPAVDVPAVDVVSAVAVPEVDVPSTLQHAATSATPLSTHGSDAQSVPALVSSYTLPCPQKPSVVAIVLHFAATDVDVVPEVVPVVSALPADESSEDGGGSWHSHNPFILGCACCAPKQSVHIDPISPFPVGAASQSWSAI
jgi:hypothetical protein